MAYIRSESNVVVIAQSPSIAYPYSIQYHDHIH
nr:MAG TPA: hypothetical protein [Caudoviricetes sp.]